MAFPTDKGPGARPIWNGATLGRTVPLSISNPWDDHGADFVNRYEIAKASYEKYGEEGPRVGCTVQTLVSGHGGGVGVHRIFAGVSEDDERFFLIYRIEDRHVPESHGRFLRIESLVHRDCWWAEIRVVEKT